MVSVKSVSNGAASDFRHSFVALEKNRVTRSIVKTQSKLNVVLKTKAQIGDIVLLTQGIGVIRYYGKVDFDVEGGEWFGIELKGPPIAGGHNGTYDDKKYFETRGGDGRGIFVRKPDVLRIITSKKY